MDTRIEILNRLLGLDRKSRLKTIVPKAQAMLIRGAPGSGKTTLALEILARKITNEDTPTFGIFLSLEVNPMDAYSAVLSRFKPELTEQLPAPKGSPKEGVIILKNKQTSLLLAGRDWCTRAVSSMEWSLMQKRLNAELTHFTHEIQIDKLKNHKNKALVDKISKKLEAKEQPENREPNKQEDLLTGEELAILPFKEGLIVLDNVNLFAEHVRNMLQGKAPDMDWRAIMYAIWSILERQRAPVQMKTCPCNLILIGEHHPGAQHDVSLLSESFACDIELLLAAEPIAGTPDIPTNLLGPLGYSFERRQISKPLSDEPQSVEIRSFCRVLKSRFTANQSRRCAYDIVAGHGVKFEEKYPGDGALLLFHENAKQKDMWEQFLTRDLPLEFPALRYSLFDRPGLQRIFATQRRFNQLEQKTDMYLACFDTYWINWYWELGQRSHLRSLIQTAFSEARSQSNEKERESWSRFLCGVDQFAKDAMMKHPIVKDTWAFRKDFLKMTESKLCKDWLRFVEKSWKARRVRSYLTEKEKKKLDMQRKIKVRLRTCVTDAGQDLANGSVGLLQHIPRKDLRLFGERCSPIIKELEREDNRVHLPRFDDKESSYLSVPYNANVSFLVCRPDLLETKRPDEKRQAQWKEQLEVLRSNQASAFKKFITAQDEWIEKKRKAKGGKWKKEWAYVDKQQNCGEQSPPIQQKQPTPQDEKDAARRAKTMKKILSVSTWEEIILLCMEGKVDKPNEASAHLVIETQTLDSFLCAFLEVFWGFGGELRISPQYEITDVVRTERKLFQAFFLFREMFRLKVIERYSTVNPMEFAERFTNKPNEWLFARHWYSTLVDVLTAQNQASAAVRSDGGQIRLSQEAIYPWTWQPHRDSVFSIQPLPYSEFAVSQEKRLLQPVSCWGEWHFAVLNGTENHDLAAELINHLMGSNAICERAARCAAIPTVEEFYERYHDVPCLRLPERGDMKVPNLTYQELRDCIFDVARSRRSIFDYRHCMREIHSVLTVTQHTPEIDVYNPNEPDGDLARQVLQAVDRIHLLQLEGVMCH